MAQFTFDYLYLYTVGAIVGIVLTLATMAGSIAIGLFGALGRLSGHRTVRALASAYVALFRGVPPLVLLYIIYFGLPTWAHDLGIGFLVDLLSPLNNRLLAAVVAFAANSGAYSTEIIRASIESIPGEQAEAARSLGMSYGLAMRRVILPQAMRVAFAPLGNEFITVLKGTSLASVIGVTELMRDAQLAAAATFKNLMAYSLAAIFYVIMVIILQYIVTSVEKRFTFAHS